ncbi:hypothetical protein SBOR_4147 [Sclerotinia borealis F-4128]|uniref:Rhodopsin domain-containing protein n=1 Tax=Sclerotinia borealis (strain F-4128) TaxID=1432307 RepID=W9CHQ4_SCLBF|nr:hypothetical protein SBOR_4147 [Sclerotinia borealis F-4128]
MQQPPAWVIASWPTPNYVDPETHGVLYFESAGRSQVHVDSTSIRYPAKPYRIRAQNGPYNRDYVRIRMHFYKTVHVIACPPHVDQCPEILAKGYSSCYLYSGVAGKHLLYCLGVSIPPQDYWKVTIDPQPNCINQSSTLLVAGIVNTLTDFLVVLLPIRTVYLTNLPRRQSLIVSFLFTLGLLSCFAGVVRTYYMYHVTQVWDQVWASYPVWITAAVELYIGIICTSIPATKAFFVAYIPKFFNSHPSHTSRASFVNDNFNLTCNSKGEVHPTPTPGLGIISTLKSHSNSRSPFHSKILSSKNSKTPLSADNSINDRTVGTSIFELSSMKSTSWAEEEGGIDEEMGMGVEIGTASFVSSNSNSNDHHDNHEPLHSHSIGRGILGSIRRDRGPDRDKNRPSENSSKITTSEQEQEQESKKGGTSTQSRDLDIEKQIGSRENGNENENENEKDMGMGMEMEKQGGWDIHIDVVTTVEVGEEHLRVHEKEKERYKRRL